MLKYKLLKECFGKLKSDNFYYKKYQTRMSNSFENNRNSNSEKFLTEIQI